MSNTAPRPSSVVVKKRSGRFVVDASVVTSEGRKRTRQRFDTKAEAEAHAKAIRQRVDAGLPTFATPQELKGRPTVLDVLEAYPKTARGAQHIEAFRGTALGGKLAEEFGRASMEGYIVERGSVEKRKASARTCGKDFQCLQAACRYAKSKDIISSHYFEKLDGDKQSRRRLIPKTEEVGKEIPDDHFVAIFAHLSQRSRRAVLFAQATGLRKMEVCSLDWQKNYTPRGFRVIVEKQKNGKQATRTVSLEDAILGERGIGLVFSELGSTPRAVYGRLTRAWRYAVIAAKGPHYRFHDLRHSYGTRLRRAGKTFSDIAAIMQVTEQTTHVYAHEDREAIQLEAIASMVGNNSAISRLAKIG